MNRTFLLCVFLAAVSAVTGAEVGETYEQVIQNQGQPTGKMQAGSVIILNYPGETVRVDKGKVIAVKALSVSPMTVAAKPATPPASTPAPAAAAAKATEVPAELAWQTDYAAALALAKKQNRKTFLFFTGSDWCTWCARLDREVLSTPDFKRFASEKLVLVKLDFPQNTKLPPSLEQQNERLAKKYDIKGYPTVIVLDSSGTKVNELGYREGGAIPFIADLK